MRRTLLLLVLTTAFRQHVPAQSPIRHPVPDPRPDAQTESRQVAEILGIASSIQGLRELQTRRPCTVPPGMAEVTIRQRILESELMASLDVDGVLSEIGAERSDLADLRTALQARRDRTVGYLNAASLITGSGVGIAVNATQLSNSTAIAGDYVGIGSGIASTVLSLAGIKKMRGPRHSVGSIPNMLAPLFAQNPVLNTYYPPTVMQYLRNVPPSEDPGQETRLQQMRAAWVSRGLIGSSDSKKDRAKVVALTSSESQVVKLSIEDLSDRMAMLADVSGRVALMKRDIATLMHTYKAGTDGCTP